MERLQHSTGKGKATQADRAEAGDARVGWEEEPGAGGTCWEPAV